MRKTALLASVTAVATLAAVAACTSSDDGGGTDAGGEPSGSITVWTTDTLPDRVAATEAIIDDFTADSGVEVDLVGVPEDQFNQQLTSAAAAGDLPDVIGSLSLGSVRTLAANDIVDTDANAAVIDALGADTFNERALQMVSDGEDVLAVPSESWLQLLYYRTDLFDEAGLAPPDSYENIMAAAQALDSSDVAGFVGATGPGQAFTEQTFEEIALANGCQVVDDAGEVVFDSPQCVEALQFYGDLIQGYSVPGAQDVDTVRANYFAGGAAMAIWSTFMLDELAGLRDDAMPSCAQCADDPAWLANNTGVVPAIQGPSGDGPAQFAQITSWTIPLDANTAAAQAFVEYFLSDGYVDWLAIAPEGKYPVRTGTADNPTEYTDAWATLPAGVDRQAPLSDFYGEDVLDALAHGLDNVTRWGITQGQGDLIGAMAGEMPIATAVNDVTSGAATPQDAATTAADAIREIQSTLP